jgi:hypothetical protein
MTSSQLDAIRTRTKNASDGPWSVRRIPNSFPSQAGDRYTHPCVRGFRVPRRIYDLAWQQVEADAEFIAHSRHDIPGLLEEVDHLRTTLQECQRAIGELLRRNEPASPHDLARIEQFLAEEDSRWEDAPEKMVKGRRLYMSVPQIRPREPRTVVAMPDADARKITTIR